MSKEKIPKISREEFLKSIREGVKDAILTMTESGDGYTGIIIREPFLKAIEDGVYHAVSQMDIEFKGCCKE